MLLKLQDQLKRTIEGSLAKFFEAGAMPVFEVEVPAEKSHGEFSSNIALKSAKILRKKPADIAAEFRAVLLEDLTKEGIADKIERIEVLNPGFINFYISRSAVYEILVQALTEKDQFGKSDHGKGKKIDIEFVSANPTGPLSVAHARQAAVGDALANIFNFTGFQATKEYYVNDEGNQINILGKSVHLRALELLGDKEEFPEDCYQGKYIYDMAQKFIDQRKITSAGDLKSLLASEVRQFAVDYLLDVIKAELKDFGVHFDVWSHQSKIAGDEQIKKVLADLQKAGHIYEHEGALWFKTTQYGDDKDRVVKKGDGSFTYFMPDIVYHADKFRRGFDKVYNILGPDHHGYIPRLTAAVEALGKPRAAIQVLIVQLATIFRDGQPVKMSTRGGQYITLREVIEEVGVDASRFFFLMRLIDAPLEFDLDLAKKETSENPVYYIQYGHARIFSIVDKASESKLFAKAEGFKLLVEPEEMDLVKKIGRFPMTLLICTRQADCFALVNYLMELAAGFHKFYDKHLVVDPKNPELSAERLALIDATRITIANGLKLLGISAPRKM